MNRLTTLLLTAILTLVAGCIDFETTIRVRSDGSGIIEEQVLVNRDALEQVGQQYRKSLEQRRGAPLQGELPSLFDEARMRMRAGTLGEGVFFLHGKKLELPKREGYRAFFGFDDINRLTINQELKLRADDGRPDAARKTDSGTGFRFQPGQPAVLTILTRPGGRQTDQGRPAPSGPADEEQVNRRIEKMRQAMRNLHFAMHVEVLGAISESNASFREGNTITLADIDFNALIDDIDRLRELAAGPSGDLAGMKERLAQLPGMRVEVQPEITIVFSDTPDRP